MPLDLKKYRLSIIAYLKKTLRWREIFGQFGTPIMPTNY